jgi:L-lysine exporter family protein LysE/ArgO
MVLHRAPAAFAAGLAFGLSLIVAVGAQNLFVLRQGALRQHILIVVAICSVSDVALVAAGVGGSGAYLAGRPALLTGVRIVGAALLLAYAAIAARRALRPASEVTQNAPELSSRRAVIVACLAFTWLNPAVYLDTVVVLGSVANAEPGHQWWFGGGAAVGSVLWFVGLGYGARLLSTVMSRPLAWRALDGFVAVVMGQMALRLLLAV